ncbi:YciI family protein [Reichenbachiella ulvae]|uniref:YciI family protein n=1 Tax=Reichenbachiella ulvae TaxID=2980104 RepID=A0ABT3CTS0_9BACT|nr:YciI family protein [Reichenbachiella ulvae]MCV9386948.1 YciI family protein [Reichenbachiella ulvae]
MNEYMMIIRGGDEEMAQLSPEEMEKHMQDWQKWMGAIAEKGQLIGGEPLKAEAISIIDGGKTVIDRPLAEGKEMVGGYIMIKAQTLKEAAEIAKGCPGFEHNCTLEVREISPM